MSTSTPTEGARTRRASRRGGQNVRTTPPCGPENESGQTVRSDSDEESGADGRIVQTDQRGAAGVTNDHQSSHPRALTPTQLAAVEMLVMGRTDAEVASQLGVARETVNRWRNLNPPFIAEMNQRRQDVWRATRERMRHLGTRALDVLDQQLQAGNVKVALAFFKCVEEEKVPSGSTNVPDVIADLVDDLNLKLLLRELRTNQDHPFARALRREYLGEDQPSDSSTR